MKKFERNKSNKDKNEEFPLYIFGIVFVYFVIMCVITVLGLSTAQKSTLMIEKPKSETLITLRTHSSSIRKILLRLNMIKFMVIPITMLILR